MNTQCCKVEKAKQSGCCQGEVKPTCCKELESTNTTEQTGCCKGNEQTTGCCKDNQQISCCQDVGKNCCGE